ADVIRGGTGSHFVGFSSAPSSHSADPFRFLLAWPEAEDPEIASLPRLEIQGAIGGRDQWAQTGTGRAGMTARLAPQDRTGGLVLAVGSNPLDPVVVGDGDGFLRRVPGCARKMPCLGVLQDDHFPLGLGRQGAQGCQDNL